MLFLPLVVDKAFIDIKLRPGVEIRHTAHYTNRDVNQTRSPAVAEGPRDALSVEIW